MGDKRGRREHTLPSPSANFTLPSLYDDLELDCRLYFPHEKAGKSHFLAQGCAVFAHPYAPLGGCYDDPVVNSVGSVLLRQGYLLVTFNFRGADQSPGHTSWSGRGELGDYTAVYALCLSLLTTPEVSEYMLMDDEGGLESGPVLLLGGYSYGSMMAAHLPDIEVVRDCLSNASDGSPEKEIENRAHELGIAFRGFCETRHIRGRESRKVSDAATSTGGVVTLGGYDSPDAARRISRDRSRRKVDVDRVRHSVEMVRRKLVSHRSDSPTNGHHADKHSITQEALSTVMPSVRYLLVSPLLGPVAGLATMFSRLKFERRVVLQTRELPVTTPEEVLSKHASLIVYGTADHFTSSGKVKAWCTSIKARPGSLLSSEEIQGAGHFWHDPAFERKLIKTVEDWLSSFDEGFSQHR